MIQKKETIVTNIDPTGKGKKKTTTAPQKRGGRQSDDD